MCGVRVPRALRAGGAALRGGAPARLAPGSRAGSRGGVTAMIRRAVRAAVPGALSLFLAGGAVGRNYKRPLVPGPERFYGDARAAEARSLADVPWWDVFDDPLLKGL